MADLTMPAGYTARPPRMDEVPAAIELFNLCDRPWAGSDMHTASVCRGFWTHPDIDLDEHVRVVHDGTGALAAYVQVWNAPPHVHTRVFGRVHPDHRGRGIGTALHAWGEAIALERATLAPADARLTLISWTLAGNDAAAGLLVDRGLDLHRHSFNMKIELDGPVDDPAWPAGIELRPFEPSHQRTVFRASREAFEDHFGVVQRDEESDWQRQVHWMETDPRCWDPRYMYIAWDGDEVAGLCECWRESDEAPDMGWVAELGVRRRWRRRGLGRALLLHSFARLAEDGCRSVGLGVDAQSLTGATRLYESVGMSTYRIMDDYEKQLRPGRELGAT